MVKTYSAYGNSFKLDSCSWIQFRTTTFWRPQQSYIQSPKKINTHNKPYCLYITNSSVYYKPKTQFSLPSVFPYAMMGNNYWKTKEGIKTYIKCTKYPHRKKIKPKIYCQKTMRYQNGVLRMTSMNSLTCNGDPSLKLKTPLNKNLTLIDQDQFKQPKLCTLSSITEYCSAVCTEEWRSIEIPYPFFIKLKGI